MLLISNVPGVCSVMQVASSLDLTILEFSYLNSKKKKKRHTQDSNLQHSNPESMGRVVTPGGDLATGWPTG